MAGTGGARPGAGRKPTREKYGTAVGRAEKQIVDRLPDIVGKLIELSMGVMVQTTDKDGAVDVYLEKPDFKAASYLVDRILGKPITPVEGELTLSGNPDKPIAIKVIKGVSMDDL